MRAVLLFFLAALFVTAACKRRYAEEKISESEMKERLLEYSRKMVLKEADSIDAFVSRRQWKMQSTGTGVRYLIYQSGNGRGIHHEDTVTISYKVFLLDGTLCYDRTDTAGTLNPVRIPMVQGALISGLLEALLLLEENSSAHIVLPSFLAFGHQGDESAIPPDSPLYIDLHVKNVEPGPRGVDAKNKD